jgi:hypothetical protein
MEFTARTLKDGTSVTFIDGNFRQELKKQWLNFSGGIYQDLFSCVLVFIIILPDPTIYHNSSLFLLVEFESFIVIFGISILSMDPVAIINAAPNSPSYHLPEICNFPPSKTLNFSHDFRDFTMEYLGSE